MHVENISTHGDFRPHHRLQAYTGCPFGRRKEASHMRTQNPSAFEQTPSTNLGTGGRVRSKYPEAGSTVW
ncbi:hypothetical protein NPIL_467981 [Nephila pilipes]|uniref:Uncharacterized protein n=1 Tax=Nephila pilipes TaxID=299642 RepID=A0A8X6U148_NEPPI|nr:hypothetical protein NPIL_358921 [Nephila pilipes]GFT79087.1 hypothetical protein NPIL_467981 [Nephila pilipes]